MVKANIECDCVSCKRRFKIKLPKNENINSGNIVYCDYCGNPNKIEISGSSQIIEGRKPSEEDLEWIKSVRELINGGPDRVDNEANSLVTLGSTLLTAYIGALTFLKISDEINNISIFLALIVSTETHKKEEQDLAIIEKKLNERFSESEFRKEFFRDPLTVLRREGISISQDKFKEIQESINNCLGFEKEAAGSILAKESRDNLVRQIFKKKTFPNSADFVLKWH